MDIQIHCWKESLGVVETRYFDSKFLKRPKAENLYYKALNNCVGIVALVFLMLCLFRATNKVLFKFRVMIINFFEQKTKNPPRTPLFYGLPKVHKPDCPLRPIVSANDSPTENISSYVNHFLQRYMKALPSYIKDTRHFLSEILNLPNLPE